MRDAETVQWVAVTTTRDRLGNETTAEADPVDVTALVAGRSSSENVDPKSPAVIVGKTLYILDPIVEPGPSDWFTVRGERYEVDGESIRWGSSGVEVAISRTGGRP